MLLSGSLTGAVPVADLSSTQTSTVQQTTVSPTTTSTSQVGTAINVAQATHDSGYAYRVTQNFGTAPDTAAAPTVSQLRIFENGKELGPAHSAHADIRTYGAGRFSHWSDGTTTSLYFSASDNSNPMTNGRSYTYLVGTASTTTTTTTTPTTTTTTPVVGTAINIAQATHDSGDAYRLIQNFGTTPDSAAAPTVSQLRIFENGRELGPAHSAHADIRTYGAGRFSHWSDGTTTSLYFSASDNSNPMTNGRSYTYLIGTASTTTTTTTTTTPTTTTTSPTTSPTQTTGQVYYVSPGGSDSNAGSASAPWHSIQTAAQRLKAGETAILLDGTYTEGQVQFANSGTAASPITIKAQNKWGAVLSSMSGDNPAISINQSYITIENLRISVSPNNPWSGVNNSANAAIRAWSTNTPSAANPSTGLVGATIRGVLVDYSPMHSVGIKTNQDFSLVENCEVHSSIEAFNNQGTTFRNNTVYGGDYWGDSVYGKGGVRNFQVYGNVVHMTNANGRGLFIGGNSSGWWYDPVTHYEAYNSIAHDNIVYNETGRTGVAALGLVGTLNCTLQNNTVTNGGALFLGKGSEVGLDPRPDPTNSTLINNTFA